MIYVLDWRDPCRAFLRDGEGVDMLHPSTLHGLGVAIEQLLLQLGNGRTNVAVVVRPLIFGGRTVPLRCRLVLFDGVVTVRRLGHQAIVVKWDFLVPARLLRRDFVMVDRHDDFER